MAASRQVPALDAVLPNRRLRGPARRDQLLDTVAQLVAAHGFAAVTIEAVSQAAQVSRPLIYGHFGDLAGLLTAVVEREMSRARKQLARTDIGELTGGEPGELLLDSLRAYLSAVVENPVTWRLVLMPVDNAPVLLRSRIADGRAATLKRLTRAINPMMATADSSIAPGSDAELTARMLSAMADEYARLVLQDPIRFSPERLLAHAGRYLDNHPL